MYIYIYIYSINLYALIITDIKYTMDTTKNVRPENLKNM